jgi:acyl-CoA reductase-like NAD-dependent aldehyde dehydrogenase
MTAHRPAQEVLDGLVSAATMAPGNRELIEVRAPYTGEIIGSIPACSEPDVDLAVRLAREAQPAWEAQSYDSRGRIFLRFHDLLLARQNEILDIVQLETGKARRHAFEEILDTAIAARYYSFRVRKFLHPRRRKGALPLLTQTWEVRVPVGVAGFIIPWNFPLTLGITDAIPALLAGNTAVLKPDPQTSFTSLWTVNLLREAGLPRDVLHVITGEGPIAGQALVDRADYLMFTGSNRTGARIAARAGERLVGCSLELGGKNPMIVLADADLNAAVEAAVRGCFAGAGQVCVSIERIYVEQPVFNKFLDLFAARTRTLKLGSAFDYSMEVGSLTTAAQRDRATSHVADALSKGATLVAGGNARPDLGPLFYEPTILTGVREGMSLYAEETFGPVVAVYPVASPDEAITRANDTNFGLSASIWTRGTSKAAHFARRIRAGSVNVNEAYAATWGSVDSPIGGMKQSGLHPRHGAEGILKFTLSQTIAVQRILPIAPSHGMTQDFFARWMTRLLRILRHLPGLG